MARKSKDPFIEANDVSVRYPVPLSGAQQSALGMLANRVSGGRLGSRASSLTHVEALRGVSVSLKPGDRLGLIGRNGAGKSTLLRLLAGLLPPSGGDFTTRGSQMNMFSIGAGMDSDLSGLENIRRMCRLLGIPRKEWKTIEEDVIDFTELGSFLAMPLRTYSAGMAMRVSFAIATAYPRDILVMDEVIGAGDAHFFEKAKTRMDAFILRASILVVASHSQSIINQLCDRCLYLDRGKVVLEGSPEMVWDMYMQSLGVTSLPAHPEEVGDAGGEAHAIGAA